MNCPRCGEPMSGGICDNCGFPMRRVKCFFTKDMEMWKEGIMDSGKSR